MTWPLNTAPSLRGIVVKGLGEGKPLGYPTANLKLAADSVRPAPGIYLTTVTGLIAQPLYGLLVCGVHQENGNQPQVEVYLLDWHQDIYGRALEVSVGHKIRNLVFTDDVAELKKLIEQDIATARQYFKM
ncbi:MAG: riboflavin kinase [Patescibacteria group bacterium]